eukprot:746459-Hanusia_phi.AAC.2
MTSSCHIRGRAAFFCKQHIPVHPIYRILPGHVSVARTPWKHFPPCARSILRIPQAAAWGV